jgi:elongation factor Tu
MSDAPAESSPRRPTISVATIGHHRHGKTTLTAAITRALARRPSAQATAISVTKLDRRGGSPPFEVFGETLSLRRAYPPGTHGVVQPDDGETLTIRAGEVRYATEHRGFVHLDSPGRRPWLKNASRAQALADALIVVVSAPDSVQPQTREHLLLAQALGIEQAVVFLNKCDLVQDGDWLDLVEHDVRELLGRCGFDGDNTRIVRGAALPALRGEDAWGQSIDDLIEALEVDLRVPARQTTGSPLLYIDHVYSRRPGLEGVLVDGRLLRGQLRRGTPLELRGIVEDSWATATELESAGGKVERVEAGDFVGILLTRPGAGMRKLDPRTGHALLGEPRPATQAFTAHLDLLAPEHGGRRTPIRDGHLVYLLFGTAVMSGWVRMAQGTVLQPGQGAELRVDLRAPVYLEPGMRFLLADGNQGPLAARNQPPRWAGSTGMGWVLERITS